MEKEPTTVVLEPNRPAIVIQVGEDGIVRVRGTVKDKIVLYGLLKAAEIAIASTDQGVKGRITIPDIRLPKAMHG